MSRIVLNSSKLSAYLEGQRRTATSGGVTQPANQAGRLDDLLRQLDALTGLTPVKGQMPSIGRPHRC
jgi:hypothetical protein